MGIKKSKVFVFFLLVLTLNLVAADIKVQDDDLLFGRPTLYFDSAGTSEVPPLSDLVQNGEYTFFIKSENPEDLDLEYYLINFDLGGELCSVVDSSTGEITCEVTHKTLTGSSNPAPTSIVTASIEMETRYYEGSDRDSRFVMFNFTLVPTNQQAYFIDPNPSIVYEESIYADEIWNLTVEAEDIDMHVPLNFSLSSEINDVLPGKIAIEQLNDTKALVYFADGGFPSNDIAGVWNVTLNVTDSFGSNATRPANQLNITLTIIPTNFPPVFEEVNETPNGTQGEQFVFDFFAMDNDENDTLTFSITRPSNSSLDCIEDFPFIDFPWEINTLSSNASNASARINQTLTVEHVGCRYVNIVVDDGEGGSDVLEDFFFNITNVNDAPEIHILGEDGDIKNQTMYRYAPFIYRVNASDPDEITYNADEYANLTYSVNDSRFDIDSNGLIYYLPTDDFFGTILVEVNVSDIEYTATRIMNISYINNTPPIADFDNDFNFSQNDNISITIQSLTGFSEDIYDIALLNYSKNGVSNFTWLLNLTANNTKNANNQIGFHSLNITFLDEKGAVFINSSRVLNITISHENDPPFFSDVGNNPITLSMGTVVENVSVTRNIFAYDYDLDLPSSIYEEEINFTILSYSDNLSDVQLIENSERSAVLSFVPGPRQYNAFIELMVYDAGGLNETQNVTFNILGETSPPEFVEILPYRNSTGGPTFEFADVSSYTINQESFDNLFSVEAYFDNESCDRAFLRTDPEELMVLFDAVVSYDNLTNESEPNNLTYNWYVDGILRESFNDGGEPETFNSSFDKEVDFFDSRLVNVTLTVVDASLSEASWTWLVSFVVNPSMPAYCEGSLENLVVNGTTTYPDYFSYRAGNQRFYRPDDDLNKDGIRMNAGSNPEPTSLVYSVNNPQDCTLVDFVFNGDDLTLRPKGIIAQCFNVVFRATVEDNPSFWVLSHPVNITVISDQDTETEDDTIASGSSPSPVSTPLPIIQEVDVPDPIRILFPGNVSIFADRTISVPVRLENTWDDGLSGLRVSASVPSHPEANTTFTRSEFSFVELGGSVSTELLITDYRTHGPFEIVVDVSVDNPEFEDSASILISSLEQIGFGEEVQIRVTFARDMLAENPECQELNFYLGEAEQLLERGEVEDANNLVSNIINSCRHLITSAEDARMESPSMVRRSIGISEQYAEQLLFWTGILTLLGIFALTILLIRERIVKT